MKRRLGRRELMRMQGETVLLCLRYGIGDLVMGWPVLEALRRTRADAYITALGAEPAVELLEGTGLVDEVISLQQWRISHGYDYGTEQTAATVREWLINRDFDLVYDPFHTAPVIRKEIYTCCRWIYDRDGGAERRALADGCDAVTAIKEGVRLAWGMEVPADLAPRLVFRGEEADFAEEWLERSLPEGGLRGEIVGVSPAASSPLKAWPLGEFLGVIDMLTGMGCCCVLFGGPGDLLACEWLAGHAARPERVAMAAAFDLRRVAAILSRCKTYVGNDTGLMHVAAAVGRPVTAVFGPTDAGVYLPRWVESAGVETAVECPYRKKGEFGHPVCVEVGQCLSGLHCMEHVDAGRVCEAVLGMVQVGDSRAGCGISRS